jgi:Tol biopolymer transport system component
MVLRTSADHTPFVFQGTAANERQGKFSPDGNWIAYTSDETAKTEVYVARFPPNGVRRLVSADGGFQPRWSSDGKELFYLSPLADDQFVAVDVLSKPADTEFRFGSQRKLFVLNVYTGGRPGPQRNSYDVAGNSRNIRFLVNGGLETSGGSSLSPVITLVLNWASQLKN